MAKKLITQLKDSNLQVLQFLSDGQYHSGAEIGSALHLTRSAIWKIVKQLMLMGIEIHSLKGKGYQIPQGLNLLNEERICSHLAKEMQTKISQLDIFHIIDSTNRYLLKAAKQNAKSGQVCLAEYQTTGHGRHGRTWYSPFGKNIYFSLLWKFNCDPSEISGLSLALAIAIVRTLKKYGIDQELHVKWPNDILWRGKKLAGVLLEMVAEPHGHTKVIIGVGINVAMPSIAKAVIDQPWADVQRILPTLHDRNRLTALLISEIITVILQFEQQGLKAFLPEWNRLDAVRNQQVFIHTAQQKFSGIAQGIAENGALILKDDNNQVRNFLAGEVSLRLM